MKAKEIKAVASRTAFRYIEGMEFVICRNCGVQYRVSQGNAVEMMHSHYPYCRGAARSQWYPDHSKER